MTSRLLLKTAAFALASLAMPLAAQTAKPKPQAAKTPAAKAPARKAPATKTLPAKPRPAAPRVATDWTKAVAMTPQGGFLLGNPNAPTKLVEYMSYSCPHCADFAEHATPELKSGWIKRGTLSIEYRNFIRDAFDLTAALVARCGGKAGFLARHEGIFSTFETWVPKAQAYTPGDTKDRSAQLTDVADKVGFIDLATQSGLTADTARKCVADPAALDTVVAMGSNALKTYPKFEGTPTFILNGKWLSGVHAWEQLKPLLPPLPTPRK